MNEKGPKICMRQPPGETRNNLHTVQAKGSGLPDFKNKEYKGAGSTSCRVSQGVAVKDVSPRFAYRQQILNEFVSRCIPIADQAIQQQGVGEEKGWLVLLLELVTSTKALEMSILAVSLASLGRQHDDPGLVRQGLKYYGQGLWELQKALWDPKLMYKDETLAACMALSTYELVECPAESRFGLLCHMNGCARLIQSRGAESHCSALGRQLFLAFRLDEVRFLLSLFGLLHVDVYHLEFHNNIVIKCRLYELWNAVVPLIYQTLNGWNYLGKACLKHYMTRSSTY